MSSIIQRDIKTYESIDGINLLDIVRLKRDLSRRDDISHDCYK